MTFAQRVKELADRSTNAASHALTEEATKTSVVMPFLQVMGFDVFNLNEVIPEFVADVGIKKGEKIDFALKIDGKVSVLVEVKPITMPLGSAQFSQLFRYFGTLSVRLAILTNGREVWFFSDIDEKNKMDKKPFFTFALQRHDDRQIEHLSRFQKANFQIDAILEAASNIRFIKAAAAFLTEQLNSPSDEFVRLIGRQVYDGSLTKSAIEPIRQAIPAALEEVIRSRIQDRLNVSLRPEPPADSSSTDVKTPEIVTTDDERQAFLIVRAIAAKVVSMDRVHLRDSKSYCSILMDDNNRKPLCRLYFNGKSGKSVGVFMADKSERKVSLAKLEDLYSVAGDIEAMIISYINS